MSPIWFQLPKSLGHLLLFQLKYQQTWSEEKQSRIELLPINDLSITGCDLTRHTIILALLEISENPSTAGVILYISLKPLCYVHSSSMLCVSLIHCILCYTIFLLLRVDIWIISKLGCWQLYCCGNSCECKKMTWCVQKITMRTL